MNYGHATPESLREVDEIAPSAETTRRYRRRRRISGETWLTILGVIAAGAIGIAWAEMDKARLAHLRRDCTVIAVVNSGVVYRCPDGSMGKERFR